MIKNLFFFFSFYRPSALYNIIQILMNFDLKILRKVSNVHCESGFRYG